MHDEYDLLKGCEGEHAEGHFNPNSKYHGDMLGKVTNLLPPAILENLDLNGE